MSPAAKTERSLLGDTTYTKVFVGGLAWETQKEAMNKYFEQFGEILEAVVITDKLTGRSKGYGFVTFSEPEAATRACVDSSPVIDGRRANCNLASLGVQRTKSSSSKQGTWGMRVTGGLQEGYFNRGIVPALPLIPSPSFPHHTANQTAIPYCFHGGYLPYGFEYTYPGAYYTIYGGTTLQYPMTRGPVYPYVQTVGGYDASYAIGAPARAPYMHHYYAMNPPHQQRDTPPASIQHSPSRIATNLEGPIPHR